MARSPGADRPHRRPRARPADHGADSHPYIEAFANLYRSFGRAVRDGMAPPPVGAADWFPGIADGLRTMAFVETAIQNSAGEAKWTSIDQVLEDRRAAGAA